MTDRLNPAAHMRWFAGEGVSWAYDAWFDRDTNLAQLNTLVGPHMTYTGNEPAPFALPWRNGWVVGERVLDTDPQDHKAAARGRVVIVRLAFLRQKAKPTAEEQAAVRGKVARLPVPIRPGVQAKFVIDTPAPPTRMSRRGPALLFAAGVLLIVMAGSLVRTLDPDAVTGSALVAWIGAIGGVLGYVGAARSLRPRAVAELPFADEVEGPGPDGRAVLSSERSS